MNCFCCGRRKSRDRGDAHDDEPKVRLERIASDHEGTSSPQNQTVAVDRVVQQRTPIHLTESLHTGNRPKVRGDGLTQLKPSLDSQNTDAEKTFDLDIVAIHGLGGDPRGTWMDEKSKVAWLEDLLPNDLPNARIFTYGYNSSVPFSKSVSGIDDWARVLLHALSLERMENDEVLVIANEQERHQALLKATKAICFFGTPHRGSDIADFAFYATKAGKIPATTLDFVFGVGDFRSDLIKTLKTNENYLDELTMSFKERSENIAIVNFYERTTIHGLLVVKKGSASSGLSREQDIPLEASHKEMCRLKDTGDIAYKTVLNTCRRFSNSKSDLQRPLNTEEEQCLNSLKPEEHREEGTDRAPNTCEWILEEFDAWRNKGLPILWVSGEFGHGKTTLMLFLKDRLRLPRADKENQANLNLCSFFCDSRSEVLTNTRLVVRNILWEMLSKRHGLLRHATPYHDEFSPWSLDKLWRVFQAAMADPKASDTIILVDGLDECSAVMRDRFFSGLISCFDSTQASSGKTITFVLTSRSGIIDQRPEMKGLSTYLKLDEDRSLRGFIHTDIKNYVGAILARLYRNQNKDEGQIASLATSIAKRSEGSFLWAVLVMEMAEKQVYGNDEDLKRVLAECPPKLEGIYYKSLQTMQFHKVKIRKTFGILLAAKRPLTLAEFQFALAVEPHHRSLDSLEAARDQDSGFLLFIRDHLGIFIKTDATTITYRHESVRDFMFRKLSVLEDQEPGNYSSKIGTWLDLSEEKAEWTLAKSCVSFLRLDIFAEPRTSFDIDAENWEATGFGEIQLESEPSAATPQTPITPAPNRNSRIFKIPFFEYAASKWGYHYAAGEPLDPGLSEEVDPVLLTHGDLLENWSSLFRKVYSGDSNLPPKLDAFLIAAYFGHNRYFEKLFSSFESTWRKEEALTWACRMGHVDIVKFSVDNGTQYTNDHLEGLSAFSWAVAEDFLDIVNFLLDKTLSLINIPTFNGSTPLLLAVKNGSLPVTEHLLNTRSVDVNLSNVYGQRAIHMAVTERTTSTKERRMIQLLLNRPDLDITPRDDHGRTVLWYAADLGAAQAIKMLLGYRRKQESIDKLLNDCGDITGQSPLFRATYNGHVDVIELLCETKKVQHQLDSVDDLDGANVFDVAAKRGHVRAVDVLGRYHPNGVNSRDKSGRTPISVAMWEPSIPVLRILHRHGADVNLADYKGRTPVSFGVQRIGHVKYLVEECGADINIPDDAEHTPLWYAKRVGNTPAGDIDIVKELILLGARE